MRYDRAVGFFSASMLSIAAQALATFIENDGEMRLIFGGEIDLEDATAISDGYASRSLVERVGLQALTVIDSIADALTHRRLEALAWMIAAGRLRIKLALKPRGMYHEKIGVLTDRNGDAVIFQGSANETSAALLPDFNFESINVFPSWRQEFEDHFKPYVEGFERLWHNNSRNTLVIEFPEALERKMVKIAASTRKPTLAVEKQLWREIYMPSAPSEMGALVPQIYNGESFQLLPHQQASLVKWRAQNLQGILALATGSGKTLTALYGISKLYQASKRMFAVIAVPYQNLAEQWIREAERFNIRAVPCYGGVANWQQEAIDTLQSFEAESINFACCVVVNRTLQSNAFQKLLERIPESALMFIGDECHHHRAMAQFLPKRASARLGLSATPEAYVEERPDPLYDYYGQVAYRYDLGQALTDGVLTPYDYHVQFAELTHKEALEYEQLSDQIWKQILKTGSEDEEEDSLLKMLLLKRARLTGSASNKLIQLKRTLERVKPHPLTLFYCGDGSVEDEDQTYSVRQIEAVSELLYKEGWKVSRFTSEETRKDRESILRNLTVGLIDAVVAIRCLDEGIDIPACRTAFILASSRNPRQFVQRRGRILRRAPGKDAATIYDYVTVLPSSSQQNDYDRRLFASELKRVAEFARLSRTYAQTYRVLEPYLKRYDLLHHYA